MFTLQSYAKPAYGRAATSVGCCRCKLLLTLCNPITYNRFSRTLNYLSAARPPCYGVV